MLDRAAHRPAEPRVPLPDLRARAGAAAAAPLLVQPPAGGLPGVQGLRQSPALRRGPRGPRPDPELGRRARWSPGAIPPGSWYQKQLLKAAKKRGVDLSRPYAELCRRRIRAVGLRRAATASPASGASSRRWSRTATSSTSGSSSRATAASRRCPRCEGRASSPEALAVKVGGATIAELCDRTIEDLAALSRGPPLAAWEAAVARDVLTPAPGQAVLPAAGWASATSPLGRQTRTPLRRRGPADQSGQPARRPADRHPLRPRRALHRAPRPRHRPPGRALRGARRRPATRWWWSSTTARSSRRPTT